MVTRQFIRLPVTGRRSDWLFGWAMGYCIDQLLTLYFSGASTVNGVHLVGISGRELSVGRLAGCRSPFTDSTLTALNLRIRKCKLMESKKKSRPTENTPRNPHQPSDRDHLETEREKTRPTREPIPAHFHRYWVCGNRPRTALAISKSDECYTHAHIYRQTN